MAADAKAADAKEVRVGEMPTASALAGATSLKGVGRHLACAAGSRAHDGLAKTNWRSLSVSIRFVAIA